ncbi:MAG: restriction endonuclease subunit S [Candidatus Aminicenantales bacterium]
MGGAPSFPKITGRRFKPYPEYKDSGAEWLTEIPSGWTMAPLKRSFDVNLGKMLQNEPLRSDDSLEPYLRAANLAWNGVSIEDVKHMWISSSEKDGLALCAGDLLISEGGDVGRSAIWRGEIMPCYYQNAINRVRAKGIDLTDYLYYWLYALKHSGYIDMLCSRATISHFTAEKVESLPVLLPPIEEQKAIVFFLNGQAAKIDALIAKKERLIELHQEKRTALITQAVTKGLDPNVPMKDSGIEWLGKIPAGWRMIRLKHIVRFLGGGTPSKDNLDYWQGEIPWVSPKDMKRWIVSDTIDKITEEAVARSATRIIAAGTVLIVVRSGILNHSIPVGLSGSEITLNQDLKALQADAAVVPEYLAYFISGMQSPLLIAWRKEGATVESLEIELIADTLIPLPSAAQQGTIISFLNRETTRIAILVSTIREAIDRLKEYRTAIVSAAVTGKIDVRDLS